MYLVSDQNGLIKEIYSASLHRDLESAGDDLAWPHPGSPPACPTGVFNVGGKCGEWFLAGKSAEGVGKLGRGVSWKPPITRIGPLGPGT